MLRLAFMKLLPLFSSLILLACIGQSSAQDFKVAVVDFKKAILAHPKAKELEASLKKEGENAASVIAAKQKELEGLRETAAGLQSQKGPDGKLTEDAFKKLLELQKKADEIKQSMIQTQSRTQLGLNDLRLKGLTEVANEVGDLVTKANNGKYALVFDSSGATRDGTPQLLDFPGADDITDQVIALLPK